ncbi:MAG: hypothetical protein ACRDPY_20755 [Streptosporangiaceae bacterium]
MPGEDGQDGQGGHGDQTMARSLWRLLVGPPLRHTEQIMVLIPVAVPDRLRYRPLHNHFDLVLTAALRNRPDILTARVEMTLHVPRRSRGTGDPASGEQA